MIVAVLVLQMKKMRFTNNPNPKVIQTVVGQRSELSACKLEPSISTPASDSGPPPVPAFLCVNWKHTT
jgi:hypothetical protein